MVLGKRWVALAFWCAALVVAALGGVVGAQWGAGQAPTFDNDEKGAVPATSASHLIYSVFGGLLLALAVVAVFAAVWLVVWARARRHAGPPVAPEQPGERLSVADMDDLMHVDEGPPREARSRAGGRRRR